MKTTSAGEEWQSDRTITEPRTRILPLYSPYGSRGRTPRHGGLRGDPDPNQRPGRRRGTLLAAEERVVQSNPDPAYPGIERGLVYEYYPGTGEVVARPAITARYYEGLRFDAQGKLYGISESRGLKNSDYVEPGVNVMTEVGIPSRPMPASVSTIRTTWPFRQTVTSTSPRTTLPATSGSPGATGTGPTSSWSSPVSWTAAPKTLASTSTGMDGRSEKNPGTPA